VLGNGSGNRSGTDRDHRIENQHAESGDTQMGNNQMGNNQMGNNGQINQAQSLDRTIQQIEKAFGKGSIMQVDETAGASVNGISTGALSLDLALGGRGLPRGRIAALHTIAAAQRADGVAAFVDAEHALDPTWARTCGVQLESLLVSQPDNGEQALDIVEMLVRSNAVDIIVVDSVAALIPRAELEGEMGDMQVGLQARMMSKAMRKLTAVVAKTNTVIIFINQIREKIGVMFGSPETTPGGRALKFYSSIRIDIRRTTSIKEGDRFVGNHVRAKVVKNKVAAPYRQAEFDIMFNAGISIEGDLIDMAVEDDIIDKSGSWFSYGETRIGQGRENAKQFLHDNPDLFEEIRTKILEHRGVIPAETKPAPVEEAATVKRADKSAKPPKAKAKS
jgi:recombination protein RecA